MRPTSMHRYSALFSLINPPLGFFVQGRYYWALIYLLLFAGSLLFNRLFIEWLNVYALLKPFGFSLFVGVLATIHSATAFKASSAVSQPLKWLWLPLFSLALPWLLRDFYSEIFAVQSESMAPTLRKGDFIVIHKFSVFNPLTVNSLQRGQRVLFIAPQDGQFYIKRIIGLGGDSIDYRPGTLIINQQAVPQTRLNSHQQGDTIYREQLGQISYPILRTDKNRSPVAKLVVPEDAVFVLGDNRDNSRDSRHFGTVNKKTLKGVILE